MRIAVAGKGGAGKTTIAATLARVLARRGYRVHALDEASPGGGAWDPNQTTANVSLAVQDPTTVAYLGDFNSGATAVAIPLLNSAGIVAVSPTATAVGLTSAGPGAAPGEPAKYYPTGIRTFVAVAPDDVAQASAQVQIQKSLGCMRTVVLNDGEFDGYDAAASFGLVAHAEGLAVVGSESFDPHALDYTSLARSLTGVVPDCVLISALPGPRTATLAAEVPAALPHAHLFATAPLAQPAFADAAHGGISAALAPRVLITVPAGAPAPGVRAAFARHFRSPGPFGLYGYAAMRLLLAASF